MYVLQSDSRACWGAPLPARDGRVAAGGSVRVDAPSEVQLHLEIPLALRAVLRRILDDAREDDAAASRILETVHGVADAGPEPPLRLPPRLRVLAGERVAPVGEEAARLQPDLVERPRIPEFVELR